MVVEDHVATAPPARHASEESVLVCRIVPARDVVMMDAVGPAEPAQLVRHVRADNVSVRRTVPARIVATTDVEDLAEAAIPRKSATTQPANASVFLSPTQNFVLIMESSAKSTF